MSADWALSLFRKSVLKQEKYRRITSLMDDPAGRRCLDIGADNGVISLLLRRRGGHWASADLDEHTVASIRELVGDDVHRLDGARSPFPDRAFDQVVVVDYLEHIPDDRAFAEELARILKPGGTGHHQRAPPQAALAGEPLPPRHRSHRRVARASAARATASRASDRLLGPRFEIERSVTYSKAFSELVDTGLNGLYLAMQRGAGDAARLLQGHGRHQRRHRRSAGSSSCCSRRSTPSSGAWRSSTTSSGSSRATS